MERLDCPERIAVGAFVCVLNRQRGKESPKTMRWLRQRSKGEIKRGIRAIRETPELQREGYPVEEIVRLLREEVMGKGLIQEIAVETRTVFPERFVGKTDQEVIGEIAGVVRRSGEGTESDLSITAQSSSTNGSPCRRAVLRPSATLRRRGYSWDGLGRGLAV